MSNDLELDEEAKALAEAIKDTPSGDSDIPVEDSNNSPVKKGASKGMKLMLGGAAVLMLAMGGAFVYTQMGASQQPVKKVKPAGPPPLSDEKPLDSAASLQPAQSVPVQQAPAASVAPAADPFKQSAPVQQAPAEDPFKQAAPTQIPAADPFKQAAPKVEEVKAPVTVVKEQNEVVKATVTSTVKHKKHHVKKHNAPKAEPDNGYVRIQ